MPLSDAQIFAFDALVFLAIFLVLLALVPPVVSRHVIRRKTWHNLMLSSLVFSVGIVLRVGHQKGTPPSLALCLVQTALDLATAPLYAAAMVSYTLDIYFSIRHMFKSDDLDGPEPENAVFLILAPWIIFLLVFLEAILVVGLAKTGGSSVPDDSWELYCRTNNVATYSVSAGIVVLGGFILVGCQATTGWLLYRNWIVVKNISITSTARKYIYAFVRTMIFTVIAILGIILGVIATFTVSKPLIGFSILLPFLPILTALIFGTYKDILSFYSFWR